jgi:DNA repair exonuclease SbcCD ATPase subunit
LGRARRQRRDVLVGASQELSEAVSKLCFMATAEHFDPVVEAERGEDLVHIELAAAALDISRRQVERLIDDAPADEHEPRLEKVRGTNGKSYVTKRSLNAVKEYRSAGPRRRGGTTHDLDRLHAALTSLTEALANDQRQLTMVTEQLQQRTEQLADERVRAATLQAERDAARERAAAAAEAIASSDELRALEADLRAAGPIRAWRLARTRRKAADAV